MNAEVRRNGKAEITIDAERDINIYRSGLTAEVGRNGKAEITIDAKRGSVNIAKSNLNAEVKRNGKAEITIDAGRNVTIWRSSLMSSRFAMAKPMSRLMPQQAMCA